MTTDTIFDLASMTKAPATRRAIAQLHEQGRWKWTSPCRTTCRDSTRPTIRAALRSPSDAAHPHLRDRRRSELPGPVGFEPGRQGAGIHLAEVSSLSSAPTRIPTTTINFILLGQILEQITGQPEDEYVAEHVFGPLGMTETRYLPPSKACGPQRIRGAALASTRSCRGRPTARRAPGAPTRCPDRADGAR